MIFIKQQIVHEIFQLLIPGGTDCPRIGKIWKSMLESNELKTKQSENQVYTSPYMN